MSEKKFQLPWGSYNELRKIIKAYESHNEGATNEQVRITGGLPDIVSRSTTFLVSIGVLEKVTRTQKKLTPKGRELANAIDTNKKDNSRVARCWYRLASASSFLSNLVACRINYAMN